ncbi:MAG: helix-turn-helix domain-containing protein [Bacteroidota bacterium]|nr:helix-turn-helix domain-containing protein [Bacteroidota bacterium]
MSFKIGHVIGHVLQERGMDKVTFAKLLDVSYPTALSILKSNNVRTEDLMLISQILKYDFFRIFSSELKKVCPAAGRNILHGSSVGAAGIKVNKDEIPHFKKHLYTTEFIETIISDISKGEISKYEALKKYDIPKTTLYRWCRERNV